MIEFYVVSFHFREPDAFSELVESYLKEGYKLHGDTFAVGDSLNQAVVRDRFGENEMVSAVEKVAEALKEVASSIENNDSY